MTTIRPLLLVDACVLIDYANSSSSVLKLVSKHVGKLHVATTVFREVTQVRPDDASRLGLTVVEPNLDMLAQAAAVKGRLSFEDRIPGHLYSYWDGPGKAWPVFILEGAIDVKDGRVMAERVPLEDPPFNVPATRQLYIDYEDRAAESGELHLVHAPHQPWFRRARELRWVHRCRVDRCLVLLDAAVPEAPMFLVPSRLMVSASGPIL